MDELGIECVVKTREDVGREAGRGGPVGEYVEFFRRHFDLDGEKE